MHAQKRGFTINLNESTYLVGLPLIRSIFETNVITYSVYVNM